MGVLVDTSIWIDYFRAGNNSKDLDYLIDENIIVINDIILAELVPLFEAQNAKQNGCKVYSFDKYFRLLNQMLKVKLYA